MRDHSTASPSVGFLGLGSMGGAMVRTLLKAGYQILAYDIVAEKLAACASGGASAAESEDDVVRRSDVVLTSLRSAAIFVEIAEGHLIPNAKPGQVFIDLGTTTAPETRRLAEAFSAKGATLIDAPVSGGPQGSATGTLRIFIGGEPEVVERCRPILETLGEPGRAVYCGPSGAGQVVKGVNQLAMGLGAAAYLEAMAFGVRDGVDASAIEQAVGGDAGWRAHFSGIARQVINDRADSMVVKFPELPYFLEEARCQGFEIPLTQALYDFLAESNHHMLDNMNRPSRSFWRELMTKAISDER